MKKHLLKMMMPVLFGAALVLTGCPTNPVDQPYKPIEPDAETMAAKIVGNCKQNFSDSYLGNGLQGIAAKLSADKLKDQGGRFRAIRVDVGAEATDCEVFIAKGDIDNVVARQEFTPDGKGWYYVEISYEYGYNEDESDFYIGMTCNTPSGVYPVGIQTANRAYSTEYIMANNEWMKLSEAGVGGYVSIQAVIDGGDYSQESNKYDLAINVSANTTVIEGSANQVRIEIANVGINKVKGANVSIVCGSQNASAVLSEELLPGQSGIVTTNMPAVSAGGYKSAYNVTVTATPNEGSNASDDNVMEFVQQIYAAEGSATRNALLIEQFTSVTCQYCPMGERALDAAIEGMSDPSKVIWIANHGNMGATDPFRTNQSDSLMGALSVAGYPSMAMNRILTSAGMTLNPQTATTAMLEEALNQVTAATLNMTREYDALSRELTVNVNGKSDVKDNLAITVLLMENGLEYSQIDYEQGTHAKYSHNHVPRAYLTSVLGDDLEVDADGNYTWSGKITVPESIGSFDCDVNNMYVISYIALDGLGVTIQNRYYVCTSDLYASDVLNAMQLPIVEGSTPDEPENPGTDVEPEGVLKYVAPMYRANALVTEVE